MTDIYVELEPAKATLNLETTTFADDDLTAALHAASREIDDALGRHFYQTAGTVTRYYTAEVPHLVEVDDFRTITEVAIDTTGDLSWGTVWSATDYITEPLNAAADDWPIERIRRAPRGTRAFPAGQPKAVRVKGEQGWPAVPKPIIDATMILAHRLMRRKRGDAPFGIVTVPGTDSGLARLARADPDVARMIARYARHRPFF